MKKIFAFIILFSLLFICFLPVGFSKSKVSADIFMINVQTSSNYIGTSPQMQITFSSPYDLAKGDVIELNIDPDVSFMVTPKTNEIDLGGKITVNNVSVAGASITVSNTINIPLPVDIVKGETLKIIISQGVLLNPETAGFYTLGITIKGEECFSSYYHVVDTSTVSNVNFQLLNNGFEIQFNVGILGVLERYSAQIVAGSSVPGESNTGPVMQITPNDTIFIRFSSMLSEVLGSLSPLTFRNLIVNGVNPPLNPTITNHFVGTANEEEQISIVVPVNVDINGKVDIVIQGINSPLTMPDSLNGDAYVRVWTSKETTAIKSNVVQIKDPYYVNTVLNIDPTIPDGNNGFYITKPTVSLAADSGSSIDKTETFVSVDGNDYQPYTGPITLNDGNHSLDYYSVGYSGDNTYKENIQNLTVKVDTTSPIINVISPLTTDNMIYTLKADVTDNNIQKVSVTLGSITFYPYESQIEIPTVLFNNDTTLDIKAVDIAGNVAEYSNVIKLSSLSS